MVKKKRKRKTSKTSAKAGKKNLKKWQAENPEEAKTSSLKHGAYSSQVRQRYTDERTAEGKRLVTVMKGLVNDLGGADSISAAQSLLLDSVRSKLIVLFQISHYVDHQETIFSDKGELIPCLGRNYTTYAESLRRDLEVLFSVKRKPTLLSYDKALKVLEGGET
jgi:hypothetical protein